MCVFIYSTLAQDIINATLFTYIHTQKSSNSTLFSMRRTPHDDLHIKYWRWGRFLCSFLLNTRRLYDAGLLLHCKTFCYYCCAATNNFFYINLFCMYTLRAFFFFFLLLFLLDTV